MTEKTWHDTYVESRTWGAKLADSVASGMGSWTFISIQTALVVLWIGLNLVGWMQHWDPFPFILLNLVFAAQASYAAPIIMQSQNRQTERDRHQADADYRTNVEAKKEIEDLQKRLARIEDDKLDKILKILEQK
jgi:uncharacterized membrane protein